MPTMNEFDREYNLSNDEAIRQQLFSIAENGIMDSGTGFSEQLGKATRVSLRLILAIQAGNTELIDLIRESFYQDLKDKE